MGKKTDYFKLLKEHMAYSKTAAIKLSEVLENYNPDDLERQKGELHVIERQADNKAHDILSLLSMEFITPIDRDDLVVMVAQIDDVVDLIDDILIRAYIYNIKEITPAMRKFCTIISSCADTLQEIAIEFCNFRKSKTISDLILKINYMEEDGDALYMEEMAKLFRSEDLTQLQIIGRSNIIEAMEKTCDAFEDLTQLMERVIMKNT